MGDQTAGQASSRLAIVVVTYKRQELLARLFDSIRAMGEWPQGVVVVDNEASAATEDLVKALDADLPGVAVTYAPQAANTGGSGGFSEGTRLAYEAGFDWLWLMDDDVAILPGALTRLRRWTDRTDRDLARGTTLDQTHAVFQGQRLNFDGTPFYWQYRFWNRLAIPNPIAPRPFAAEAGPAMTGPAEPGPADPGRRLPSEGRAMNTACFEGGVFHRRLVEQIGLPDYRFFIYWDDTIYGYLASKVTRPLMVSDLILERTRTLDHFKLGHVRKLNATSDMARYHIMRNRGYMAQYLRRHGDYTPALFGLGTAATFAKEVIRLFITGHVGRGLRELWRGWRDARPLLHDAAWQPMPPLAADAASPAPLPAPTPGAAERAAAAGAEPPSSPAAAEPPSSPAGAAAADPAPISPPDEAA